MTLKKRNHLLICLEGNKYNCKVLIRGARLAIKYGCTFEVLFFFPNKSEYNIFHLLNITESKNLSKRLGATKFTLKKTENEQHTAKELVNVAIDHEVREIVISGVQKSNSSRNALLKKIFYFNKFNYILKYIPKIVLVLINHNIYNPFEKGEYENGRKAYLVKRFGIMPQYVLKDKPYSEKDMIGLFFQRKDAEESNGLFAYFRNGKLMYVYICNRKVSI